jgi:hypothetical protein
MAEGQQHRDAKGEARRPPPVQLQLPTGLHDSLQGLLAQILNDAVKRELWTNRFTAADRKKFAKPGMPDPKKINVVEMWHIARGTPTWNECIVEVAHAIGFINASRRESLLDQLGAQRPPSRSPARATAAVPHWDDEARELRYRNRVVRVVKRPRQAHNIVAILRAFEAAGWPPRIDDQHGRKPNAETRRRDVSNLNRRLDTTLLKFACDGNGTGFLWQKVVQPKAAKPAPRPRE